MRKLALLVALCLFAPAVVAATRVPSGTLSAVSGAPCVTGDANSIMLLTGGANSVTVTLSGTFSGGVIQFKASSDDVTYVNVPSPPQAGGTAVTSAATTGTWSIPTAQFHSVCLHASALSSGTVTVTLDQSFSSTYTAIASGVMATLDSTTALLGISATYTGPWVAVAAYKSVVASCFANVAGTLNIDQGPDGSNADVNSTVAVAAGTAGAPLVVNKSAPFARLRYVNGAGAQGTFRCFMYGSPL